MKLFVKNILIKLVLSVACLFVVFWILNNTTNLGEPLPKGSESLARLADGPYKATREVITFIDSSRPTQENKRYKGADSRTLESNIWYPENSKKQHPLIIFSHGIGSNKDATPALQEYLTTHGYVVIAPNFPLNYTFAPGGPLAFDVINHPGDVSFLISQAIELSQSKDSFLLGKVDPEKIGLAGISLGGLTSTLASFHPDSADQRVKAVVSIAGPTSFFTSAFYQNNPIPLLMIAGGGDRLVDYEQNAAPIPDIYPGTGLLTLEGGSHTGFADGLDYLRWTGNPDKVGCWAVNRNLEAQNDPRWKTVLGDTSAGIDYQNLPTPCVKPLPKNPMNAIRQTKILRIAVRAFFDGLFLGDNQQQLDAQNFLSQTLSEELDDVNYRINTTF